MARHQARWTVEPGRELYFDGHPALGVTGDYASTGLPPTIADGATKLIADLFNRNGVTPDSIYEKHMGSPPRKSLHKSGLRAREGDDERKFSMTYGQIPPFEQFERDIRRPDPEHDGNSYWPVGTLYPMELVSSHEIELAETFGLEEFQAERQRTGRNTRVRGFRDNERAIYEFVEFLADRWNNGDEEAGDLASSIMYTLGYEWI